MCADCLSRPVCHWNAVRPDARLGASQALQGLSIMPTAIRRETRACPRCSLPLTIVAAPMASPTFEYDVAKWARLCHHPDTGGPLTCPGLQPVVKAWLGD